MSRRLSAGVLCAIVLVAGALAPAAFSATTKPVIAVLNFETEGAKVYWSSVMARYLMTAVAYMGEYKVVGPEKVAKIMEGSGIAEGGAVSTADAVKLAKQLGAAAACRGKLVKAGDQYTVTVDFISTVNGAIIATKSAKVTGEENLSKAIDRIVGLTP